MEERTHPHLQRINLAWAVAFTIGLSMIMVIISITIFLQSGAYDTVKQIRAADSVLQTNLEGIDTSSPIQAIDLQEYSESLPQRVKSFNDSEDFGAPNL